MKRFQLVVVFSIFALVLGTAVPAMAAPVQAAIEYKVLFQNRTGENVTIKLTGPKSVTLNLPKKSTTAKLPGGVYNYSYTACGGKKFSGQLNVNRDGVLLSLLECKSQGTDLNTKPETVKLVIINKTGSPLTFVFVGPQTYRFVVPVGKLPMYFAPGKYHWTSSGNGCGGYSTDEGNINIKVGYSWTWYCNE